MNPELAVYSGEGACRDAAPLWRLECLPILRAMQAIAALESKPHVQGGHFFSAKATHFFGASGLEAAEETSDPPAVPNKNTQWSKTTLKQQAPCTVMCSQRLRYLLTACRKESVAFLPLAARASFPLPLAGPYRLNLEGATSADRPASSRNQRHSCPRA